MDLILPEVPLQYGFAPDEWNPMADCFLPKKEDNLIPDTMRTICLMDAAYNMNAKWYGRQFMSHNERLNTLSDDQGGGRKNKNCPEYILKKVLTADISKQKRQAGFLCSNDAIQCYDRVVHSVAMLSMLRLGADRKAIASLFKQLQQAEHFVTTAHGMADRAYGGKKRQQEGKLPFQGVLQGNGMGPCIWLAISMLLLTIMHCQGHVASFKSAMTASTIDMVGFLIVDDADLIFTAPTSSISAEECLPKFQAMVDCWEENLRVTGGGIKPSKSFWYMLDYKWSKNKWEYLSAEDSPGEIFIREPNLETRVPLERLEPSQSRMTLGVEIAMDGNQEGEKEYLRQKTEAFADNYRMATGLDKDAAWEGFLSTIMATLRYPVAATQLTKADWDYILAPVWAAGLPKAGISRMFPHAVLNGPSKYQGMGVMHMYDYQELEHLALLLQHGNKDTTLKELFKHSWEELRLELGVSGSLTDWNFALLGDCATDCWLKTLWHYCRSNEIGIIDPEAQLQLIRENDQFLMEVFINAKFTAAELIMLNQCRCFLKVITTADITNAYGKQLTPGIMEGILPYKEAISITGQDNPQHSAAPIGLCGSKLCPSAS